MTFKVARFSFHHDRLLNAANRLGRGAIMRGLAFVRRRTITQKLRRRKTVSRPGDPPHVHSRDKFANLKNVRFAWDERTQSGVVGPVLTNQRNLGFNGIFARGTVPRLHEEGGVASIREKRVGRRWVSVGRRRPRPGQATRTRRAVYPPRPFIRPAAEDEIRAGTFRAGPQGSARPGPMRRAA